MLHVSRQGHPYPFGPHPRHHQGVHGERGPGHSDLVPRRQERLGQEFEEFIAPAAENQLVLAHPQALGQAGAQGKAGPVGIAVDRARRVSENLEGLRRGPQWVFVGGEFQ